MIYTSQHVLALHVTSAFNCYSGQSGQYVRHMQTATRLT